MPDYFGLPDGGDSQQWFSYNGEAQPWLKPRGARFIHFFVLGPGGTGGAGATGATSTTRTGGGGGGAAATANLIIAAWLMPDIIYVFPSLGGSNVASVVSLSPTVSPAVTGAHVNFLIQALSGGAGGNGTSSTGGTTGSGGAAISASGNFEAGIQGNFLNTAGGAGTAGGVNNVGSLLGLSNEWMGLIGPGVGGGGASSGNGDAAGGSMTGVTPNVGIGPQSVAGGAAGGGRGVDGWIQRNPFLSYGGTGGGSNAAGTGGAGGNGGPGAGGGGGGGGINGGPGGLGGNGLVVVSCW